MGMFSNVLDGFMGIQRLYHPHTVMSNWEDQECFVIQDEPYDRMFRRLMRGKRYELSYSHVGGCSGPRTCKCPKMMNVLRGGKMVRLVKGEERPVYKMSVYNMLRSSSPPIEICSSRLTEEGNSYLEHVAGLARLQTFPLHTVIIHTSTGKITLTNVPQDYFDSLVAHMLDETPPPISPRDYDMV